MRVKADCIGTLFLLLLTCRTFHAQTAVTYEFTGYALDGRSHQLGFTAPGFLRVPSPAFPPGTVVPADMLFLGVPVTTFESCLNCDTTSKIFFANEVHLPWASHIQINDVNNHGYLYQFPLGAFSRAGTYQSGGNGNVGRLVVSEIPQPLIVNDNKAQFHVFPQFVDGKFPDGSGYRSTLMVSSDSTSSINCTGTILNLVPGLGPDARNLDTLTIAAGGLAIISTPGTQQPLRVTYATLYCSAPVTAQLLYSYFSESGSLVSEATVFSSPVAKVAQLVADQRKGARLGFAVANDGLESSEFLVQAFDSTDVEIGRTNLRIAGRSQTARFINDLIPLPSDFVGRVLISAATPEAGNFYAMGLRFTGAVFTTIPVTLRNSR